MGQRGLLGPNRQKSDLVIQCGQESPDWQCRAEPRGAVQITARRAVQSTAPEGPCRAHTKKGTAVRLAHRGEFGTRPVGPQRSASPEKAILAQRSRLTLREPIRPR